MRAVDLFSGCGGMSKGFQDAGFEIISAFEYWDTAIECYRKNFTHPIEKMDLTDVDLATSRIKELKPEIIIGGPPCQDFSSAGKRIESERANLTVNYAEIVCNIRPKYFVMENVSRAHNSEAYKHARDLFHKAGYGLTEKVLDASFCGVPQSRKRFFCIGSLNETDCFADKYIQENISDKAMTLRDYFGETLDLEYYYRHPRNYTRRAIFSIDEPAPTIRGVNRPVPKGYVGNPNDACPINENIRSLTTLERSLIQTFPSDFKWVGTKTDTEQMIGNAVPVNLAKFVASALRSYIDDQNQNIISANMDSFVNWLIESHGYTMRSASDTISRLKRADKIYSITNPKEIYEYNIERNETFISLSRCVKSQIKKAVCLFNEYQTSC